MAGYSLGTARGIISIVYDGRGVAKAKKDLGSVAAEGDKTQKALGKVGNVAGGVGLVIAAGLGYGVKSAADFEQRMSAVAAVSGATGKEFDDLRGKALQLGKDTQYSATDAASAIEELVKAGVPVAGVLNGAADAAVNLAAAGEVDLKTAATIAANAMNQFGLAAEQMPHVADLVAGAANASAIDVGDFGMSLSQVGAVAKLAGVSFDDTAKAIAIMGNAGIKGSDAGTSLKSMFMRLQPTTDKQAGLMKKLGLVTKDGANQFYTAEGKTKSLAQVSQVLQNSLKGMSAEQKQAALNTLFGSDAIRAAAILSESGAKGFDKMGKAMGKVSAADVAAKRNDNLKGSLDKLKGSLETAGIAVGTILLPALRRIVDAVTSVANAFLNMPGWAQKAVVAFALVAASTLIGIAAFIKIMSVVKNFKTAMDTLKTIGAVGKAMTKVKGALTALTTGLRAMGAAMLANPVFLIIAGLVALGIALVILYKKSETFRKIVNGAWAGIKKAVGAVIDWFKSNVLPVFEAVWNGIKTGVTAVVNFVKNHWRTLLAIFGGPLGLIIALVTKFWPQIKAAFTTGINAIKAVWTGLWNTFAPLVSAVFGLIKAVIQLAMAIIMMIIRTVLSVLIAYWSAVWNAIKAVASAVWNGIRAVISAQIAVIRAIITRIMNAIRAIWGAIWGAIGGTVTAVWNRIRGVISAGANAVRSIISSAFGALKGIASKAWGAVVGAVGGKISELLGKVKGIAGKVKGALSGAASWLVNAGKDIINGLIAGITSKIKALTDKLHSITKLIPKKKGPEQVDKTLLTPNGELIMKGLIGGVDSMIAPFEKQLRSITRMIPSSIGFDGPMPAAASAAPAGGAGNLKMVSGTLSIDKSGRAYIQGLATEVVDANSSYLAETARRNG